MQNPYPYPNHFSRLSSHDSLVTVFLFFIICCGGGFRFPYCNSRYVYLVFCKSFPQGIEYPPRDILRRWISLCKGKDVVKTCMIELENYFICNPLQIMKIYGNIYFIKTVSGDIYLDFPVMTVQVFTFAFMSPQLMS